MATIQIDLTMLPERFDLTYIDENGEQQRPIAIHRAIYGSLERFIGILDRALRAARSRCGSRRSRPSSSRSRTATSRPPRSSPACCARAACGSRSTTRPTGCRTRSGSPRSRRCRTCSCSATARSRRARPPPGRRAGRAAAGRGLGGPRRPARGGGGRAGRLTEASCRDVIAAASLCYRRGFGRVGLHRGAPMRTTYRTRGATISRDLRVNQMIRIPQVRVVDEEGAQLGVMPTPRALEMAQERGLDLVEVAPMARPPVVKFLDFGQYKYELTKREKEAKRKQRSVTFKEVRLSPKIGVGDFDTKVHRAIEFLEDGDRIKVTVRFRGRELTHPELGRDLLAQVRRSGSRSTGSRSGRRCSRASRCTSRWHRPTSRRAHDAPDRRHAADEAPADATADAPRPHRQRRAEQRPQPAPADDGTGRPKPAPAATGAGSRPSRRRRRRHRRPAPQRPNATETDRRSEHAGPRAGDDRRVRPRAQDEEPQGGPEADRRDRQRQGHPRQRLARPPPRDQVVAPDPPLRRQVRHRARRTPSRSGACCRTSRSRDTVMARVKRGVTVPQAPQAPPAGRRGPQGHQVAAGQAGARGAPPRARLRDPRPQAAQAPDARAVDRPDQRGGPPERPDLRPVHRRPEEGRHRDRPQDPGRPRRPRRRHVRHASSSSRRAPDPGPIRADAAARPPSPRRLRRSRARRRSSHRSRTTRRTTWTSPT